jgi:hypothetical protein
MTALIHIVAALGLTAGSLAAQDSTGKPASKPSATANVTKPDTTAKAAEAAPSAPVRHSLSQFVIFPDGRPASNATVVAVPVGSKLAGRGAVTDTAGRFTIDSLPAGRYDLRVMHQAIDAPLGRRITVDGTTVGDIVVPVPEKESVWWTVLAVLLYLLIIMLARWHNIGRPLDEVLKGQFSALTTRLALEVDPALNSSVRGSLDASVQRIQNEFKPTREKKDSQIDLKRSWRLIKRLPEFLMWSRGRENAAWVAIHEVERQMAAYLTPREQVVSYLQLAQAQLRVLNTPPALALAETIRTWLPTQPTDPITPAQDDQRRALLGRAIALVNEERDKQFASLMEWHNKASWLVLACLVMIVFLAAEAGHAVLFLAGAAGGFLSRLMRAIRREEMPLDYGASWTTLFLSPLLGALVAWFGIAIISLATHPSANLLGDTFGLVNWNVPDSPATLAVAFVLGFSERLFDSIVGAVERRAGGTRAADEAAKAASAAAGALPGRAATGDSAATTSTASTNGTRPAAAVPGGPRIELDNGPMPVGVVIGKVVLDQPLTTPTGVNLSTNRPEFELRPTAFSIPAGQKSGEFELVPRGNAPGGPVQVIVRVGNTEMNDIIEFE